MILLGLAGAAGVGKDTVADYLCDQYNFIRFSFSDALYREVSQAFDVPEAVLRDRLKKETPLFELDAASCKDPAFAHIMRNSTPYGLDSYTTQRVEEFKYSPRWVLQHWGTEYRRAQDENYWLKKTAEWMHLMFHFIKEASVNPDYTPPLGFVNTSVRFENEAKWIRDSGGTVWHIRRDVPDDLASEQQHEAEQPLPLLPEDRELFNIGTLEQLGTAVSLMLASPDKAEYHCAVCNIVIDGEIHEDDQAAKEEELSLLCESCYQRFMEPEGKTV